MSPERSPGRTSRALRGAVLGALALGALVAVLLVLGVPIPLISDGDRAGASADAASAITDADEDGSREAERPGLSVAPPVVRTSEDAAAAGRSTGDPAEGGASDLVALEGAVVRGDGRPAGGARVTAVDGLGLSESAEADATGRFRLALPPGKYDLIFRAGRDGSLLVRSFLIEGAARADLSFTLGGASSIRVEATQDGRGVQGAQVRTYLRFDGAQERLAEGTTGLDGVFVAEGMPAGPYTVEVEATEGVVFSKRLDVSDDVTLAFPIPAPVRVSGYVEDAAARAPVVARIEIGVQVQDGISVLARTESAPDGGYGIEVPKGRVTSFLAVGPEEYAPFPAAGAETNGVLQSLRPVSAGQPVVRPVSLRTGAVVSGTVLLDGPPAARKPVENLVLRLQPNVGPPRTATTAADGTYRIQGVGAGRHLMLVETPGWYLTSPTVQVSVPPVPPGGGQPIVFDLRVISSGVVSGQVVLADGTAAAGARVWLVGGGGAVRGARRAGRALEDWTGADGSFSIDDVPPGAGGRVRAALGEAEATPGPAFRIADGAPPPQRLVLTATGAIRGRLTDLVTREPVDAAQIRVDPVGEPAGRSGRQVRSGPDGRYDVAGLIPGRYRLVPQKRDYLPGEPREVDLPAESREVDLPLVLDPGLVVGGSVVDLAGNALSGVRLSLDGFEDGTNPPKRARRWGRTDARGAWRWTALRPGSYSLYVNKGGFKPLRFDRLRGGEDRLRIVMEVAAPPPTGGK